MKSLTARGKLHTRSGAAASTRRAGGAYAESQAPSSVRSKSRRAGGTSVADSSAWGSDDTGLESVIGAVHSGYIDALRRSNKRSKVAVALPAQWLPEARWELVKPAQSVEGIQSTRCGCSIVAVPPPAASELGGIHGLEHVYIIGGYAGQMDLPIYSSVIEQGPSNPSRSPSPFTGTGKGKVDKSTNNAKSEKMTKTRSGTSTASVGGADSPRPGEAFPPRHDQGLMAFELKQVSPTAAPWEVYQASYQADWHSVRGYAPPRQLAGCAACAVCYGSRIVVFGGLDLDTGEVSGSLYIYDVQSGTWRDESKAIGPAPPAAMEAAMAEARGGQSVLVHGGRASSEEKAPPVNVLRRLDLGGARPEWREVGPQPGSSTEPLAGSAITKAPQRRAHSLVTRGEGNVDDFSYIFGGYNEAGEVCSDVFILDLGRGLILQTTPAGGSPVPRAYHSAVALGPYMIVYGGITAQGATMGELRLMHFPTLMWATIELQQPTQQPTGSAHGASGDLAEMSRRASDEVASDAAVSGQQGIRPFSRQSSSESEVGDRKSGPATRASPRRTKCERMDPLPRSHHGAVALKRGSRPGEASMLIFGGRGGKGEVLGDVCRLVLQMPRQREPGCAPKVHPDVIYDFVMANLQASMLESAAKHQEQLAEMRSRQKETVEETRNLETRALGARAQTEKHQAMRDKIEEEMAQTFAEIASEQDKLEAYRWDTKARLRELEIEADSLRARLQRTHTDQTADFQCLGLASDLDMESSTRMGEVPNELVPTSQVERREAHWKGARTTIEIINFASMSPRGSMRGSKSIGQRKSWRGRSARHASVGSPPRTSSHSPERGGRRSPQRHTMGAACGTDAALAEELAAAAAATNARWEEAVRLELRIVGTLRHPNLQELYGGAVDTCCAYMICEPFLDTLAARLSREGGRRGSAQRDALMGVSRLGSKAPPARAARPLSEPQRLHISCDLTAALEYLHTKGVTHRHIILENAFLLERGIDGLTAKLGGHFAARVSCRSARQVYVPCPSVRASLDDGWERQVSLRRLADFDGRPLDVLGMGFVLLRLWVSQEAQGNAPKSSGDAFNTEDDSPLVRERKMYAAIAASDRACAERIRDASVRLVVTKCLTPEAAERPSAAVLRLAFAGVQEGDISELPTLAGEDPTITSLLADLAAEAKDEEEEEDPDDSLWRTEGG